MSGENPNTIQLGMPNPPAVDWPQASRVIEMLSGNVAVEMEEATQDIGSESQIILSEVAAGRLRPDTGTVLAVGVGVGNLQPGDRVCVLPYDGKHFSAFEHSIYKSKGRVRMLGVSSMNEYERSHTHHEEVIVAKLGNGKVKPIGRWVLIRRFAEQGTQSGIELPDSAKYREQKATVIACGERCESVKPDDVVIYQGKALVVDFQFGERYGFEGDPKDYCLIHEDDLHCILREAA